MNDGPPGPVSGLRGSYWSDDSTAAATATDTSAFDAVSMQVTTMQADLRKTATDVSRMRTKLDTPTTTTTTTFFYIIKEVIE